MCKLLMTTLFSFLLTALLITGSLAQDTKNYMDLVQKNEISEFDVKGTLKIGYEKALELHNEGVTFIDVRRTFRYDTNHIPGAINLELYSELTEENLAMHAAMDQKIVFYCSDAGCFKSAHASAKAITWGYTNVIYFAGGWSTWKTKGSKSN